MAAQRETVVIVRKAKVDKLKPTAGAAVEIPVKRCVVIPRASNETDGGWVQVSGYTVIARVGSDIRPDDQIRVRGELHSVIGEPGVMPVRKGKLGVFVTTERVGKAAS